MRLRGAALLRLAPAMPAAPESEAHLKLPTDAREELLDFASSLQESFDRMFAGLVKLQGDLPPSKEKDPDVQAVVAQVEADFLDGRRQLVWLRGFAKGFPGRPEDEEWRSE